jgi:cobalt-zinc-cadmium efflux system membrane fusion protein
MNHIISYTYTAIFAAFVLTSCHSSSNEVAESEVKSEGEIKINKKQFQSFDMQLGAMTLEAIQSTISTRGFIDIPPGNKASVTPFHGGYIKDIDLLPGQKVKKGELLFTIQNPEFIEMQQEYLETKEQLNYLKADFERQKALAEENISSQKNFKKSESDYKVKLAKFSGLKEQLKLINISIDRLETGKIANTIAVYAPISGYITTVTANKGLFVDPSNSTVEISNMEHIHLELKVFEKDVMKLIEEQPIAFIVPESGDKIFHGAVHLVGKSVSEDDRTINVHGHIMEKDEGKFIPGMFVDATIITGSDSLFCLPKGAVISSEGLDLILIKTGESNEGYTFESKEIRTGVKNDQWVQILNMDDLQNKEVLIRGGFNLIGE